MIKENPAKGAKLPPAPLQRIDFLTADEVDATLSEAEQRARTTETQQAVVGSLRRGLACGATWSAERRGLWTALARHRSGRAAADGRAQLRNDPQRAANRGTCVCPKSWFRCCESGKALSGHPDLVCPLYRSTERRWAMAVNSNRQHGLPQLLGAAGCPVLDRPHMLRHTLLPICDVGWESARAVPNFGS